MLEPGNIFEILKRKKRVIKKEHTDQGTIYFQLKFDSSGAYIHVVDDQSNPVDASYEKYSGVTRELLKSIDNIHEKNSFRIDWNTPHRRVYLADNEFLIWQLRHCKTFVTDNQVLINFVEDTARLILQINENKEKHQVLLESDILLRSQGSDIFDIQFINESHVYHDGHIYMIDPVGEHFQNIQLFKTLFLEKDLNKYLALFFSFFINIQVRYQKYKIIQGDPRHTTPIIIIEKVSEDHSLFLKISQGLPGFDAHFLEHYDIAKIAVMNDLEKKILICDVHHGEVVSCFDEINSLLKKNMKKAADAQYFVEDNLFIITESLATAFIYNELPRLLSKFHMYGADKLKPYNVRAVNPKLNVSLNHHIDFLEGSASLDIEGEQISLFDALSQFKKNAYIALNDGTHAIVNREYMEKLRRLFQKNEDQVRLSFFDLPIVEELIDEKTAADSFQASRDVFLGFNTIKSQKMKMPKLNAKLRKYQKQGYKWIRYLHQHGLGGCLADDMGLGKTLQAIALLSFVYPAEKTPSLVVMPKSLLFNWENEILKFSPDLTYGVYYGINRKFDDVKDKHLILTTYAVLRNDIELLKEQDFYYVILDESQHIKNPNAQTSKAAVLLQASHRLGLSGTPVENNLGELYSLFRFLNPAMFGSIDQFNLHYGTPIQKEGNKEALDELKKKIYPFILRRLKQDVLKDLPDKIEQVLYVEMSDPQKQLYDQRRLFYQEMIRNQIEEKGIRKSQFYIFQALSELRQIASIPEAKTDDRIISPKREVLLQHVLDLVEQQHKLLVFANFLHALDCIAEDLVKHNIEFVLMTGATRDRKKLVEQFQEDDTTKVFLMTLKTGGVGLNLTAADYIFLFDPWWNIAAETQAVDRTHRIGQDKTVFSYKLIAKGSIEEKILELQQKKRELFDNLISSDGASIKSLDIEDIEFVLGG
ncbi:MAG: DEAD/DEAH box helicase [Candidatus Magnetomorum sp.]|nr:DEAD/DEAH box helicase [Candidatus Magnetomorum sp.]